MITIASSKERVLMLTHPCRCEKCENSCNFGSGAMEDDDVKALADHLGIKESELKDNYLEEITKFNTTLLRPKLLRKKGVPYGRCIFYDETKGCMVHEAKPLECKIAMGCKPYGEELILWFNLRYFLNPTDPESLRQYKIYLESGGKTLRGASFEEISEKTEEELFTYEDRKDRTDWDKVLGIKGKGDDKDGKK